ncbi:metalloendopeptidase OMA1, mitochondrial isoform X3 [Petromyzon marinus]|uniref:Metalloendopeptidase OMA1, mitochondrial n=1 Tax=Petromyzon marinus TaxID=7757 RepID=A0AAJ7WV61_PETMA|nr:metalloendopeptidase OMA1, mitochondrial isoform X3 [Petromyzon marinus]
MLQSFQSFLEVSADMHHRCWSCASHLSAPQRQSVSARAMLRSSARCLRVVSGHLAHRSRFIAAAEGSSLCRVQRPGRFDGSADERRRAPMCLGRVSCLVGPRGTPCATATRTLHLSSRRSAPPALLWLLTKPLQKLVAMILGRSLRKWWQGLPQDKRALLREWASRNRGRIAMVVLGIGGLSVAFYVTHLDETPLTGRRRLLIFSSEQLTWLSEMEYNETMEEYKDNILPKSHAAHRAVALAVQQLVERNQDVAQVASTPWTVSVVDLPKANAYVLPNGQIFVFTGMLEKVANADQLGIVLGHEMAHAVLGHAAEKASFLHFIDVFSLVFITIIWAVLPRDWLSALGHWAHSQAMQLLLDMPYSRQLEREADEVGLKLAAKFRPALTSGPVLHSGNRCTRRRRRVSRCPSGCRRTPRTSSGRLTSSACCPKRSSCARRAIARHSPASTRVSCSGSSRRPSQARVAAKRWRPPWLPCPSSRSAWQPSRRNHRRAEIA